MKLILASQSPRRAQLMREAGFVFQTVRPDLDEASFHRDNDRPEDLTARLALAKAEKVAQSLDGGLVIGCDTVVCSQGRIHGKPTNANEARTMLEGLFDQTHRAITSVACLDAATQKGAQFTEVAEVFIENPGDQALAAYLDSGAWAGKAGGYNLAELTDRWTLRIEGDPNTVIGLPIHRLKDVLRDNFGFRPMNR